MDWTNCSAHICRWKKNLRHITNEQVKREDWDGNAYENSVWSNYNNKNGYNENKDHSPNLEEATLKRRSTSSSPHNITNQTFWALEFLWIRYMQSTVRLCNVRINFWGRVIRWEPYMLMTPNAGWKISMCKVRKRFEVVFQYASQFDCMNSIRSIS